MLPSECELRVYLRANHEPEAEPSEFERVLMRLGQRHEAAHVATFPQGANLAILPFESRAERTQVEYGGSWSMAKYIEATETEDQVLRQQ